MKKFKSLNRAMKRGHVSVMPIVDNEGKPSSMLIRRTTTSRKHTSPY